VNTKGAGEHGLGERESSKGVGWGEC